VPSATGTVVVRVWFARTGKLAPTSRTRPATPATSRLALAELAAGPSTVERTAGLDTAVAAGTLFDVEGIAGGTATVACPAAFLADDGPALRLRQAQVVYTLTQFPTVSRVAFRAGGGPATAALAPADVADLLPPVVVYEPAIGQRVTSPVTVSGTADVFEAVVSLRILDARGTEVATRFTGATCGTGCRGSYSTVVPYRVGVEQPGTVEVFHVSARDGSRVDVVDIPVTLGPS
jgi:hypothetical protein